MMGVLLSPSYITLVTLFYLPSHHTPHPIFYITPHIPLYDGGMYPLSSLLTLPLSLFGVSTNVLPPSDVKPVNSITPPTLPSSSLSTEGSVWKLSSIPRCTALNTQKNLMYPYLSPCVLLKHTFF